jgi:membrane-associated protein
MVVDLLFFFLDVENNLYPLIDGYGDFVYVIFFLLAFLETGFILTPFLPGNTLLFVAGALAASGILDLKILFVTFFLAAVACDGCNFGLGKFIGVKVLRSKYLTIIRGDAVERTHQFYEKYGGSAIILARFFPYIRDFTPFLAGAVNVKYDQYLRYDIVAVLLWSAVFLLAGYYIGNIPIINQNIGLLFWLFIIATVLTILFIAVKVYQGMRTPT